MPAVQLCQRDRAPHALRVARLGPCQGDVRIVRSRPPLPGVPGLLKIASKKEGVLEKLSKPCVGAMGTEVRVNSEKLWTRVYANP